MKKIALACLTLLTLCSCATTNNNSNSKNESLSYSKSSSKKVENEKYVEGICAFDSRLGVDRLTMNGNITFEAMPEIYASSDSGGYTIRFFDGRSQTLSANASLYFADANCDGHLDILYTYTKYVSWAGALELEKNEVGIYDVFNSKMLLCEKYSTKIDIIRTLSSNDDIIYIEECDIKTNGGNYYNHGFRSKEIKFLKNKEYELKPEYVDYPFVLKNFDFIINKTPYNSDNTIAENNRYLNTYDIFRLEIKLHYEGNIKDNTKYTNDCVTFDKSRFAECKFISYENGILSYDVKFNGEDKENFIIEAQIQDVEGRSKIFTIDERNANWSANRNQLKDIVDFYDKIKSKEIVKVGYTKPYDPTLSSRSTKEKLRKYKYYSTNSTDIAYFRSIFEKPIEYVDKGGVEGGLYRDVIYVTGDDKTFRFSVNGNLIVFGGRIYKFDFEIKLNEISETCWSFLTETSNTTNLLTLDSRHYSNNVSNLYLLEFYDFPDDMNQPTYNPSYEFTFDNQHVYVYSKNIIKTDDIWYLIKGPNDLSRYF